MRKMFCDRCGNEIDRRKLKRVKIEEIGIDLTEKTEWFDVCEICAEHIREEFEYGIEQAE